MTDGRVKEAVEKQITKEGLPKEAFAIVGDAEDPETWKLPHHKKSIFRALQGKLNIEKTVDWERSAGCRSCPITRGLPRAEGECQP